MRQADGAVVLERDDYYLVGEREFGVPGLTAVESIGPFVRLQASGPLIMIHDGRFEPRHGIGHHPHRFNERLFYILQGAVDHDDALNDIQGHMGTGDVGRLTEGVRGMLHKEWNGTDGPGRAYILVYSTDPVPPRASFEVLRDADAPRYEERDGVRTKELVGHKSPLPIYGDIRFFADSELEPGAGFDVSLGPDEGGVVFALRGAAEISGVGRVDEEETAIFPPSAEPRAFSVRAPDGARLIRVLHGPGHGFQLKADG